MSDLIVPGVTYRPVVNESGSMVVPIRGFVPHVQVGYDSLFDRFNDPTVQASAHGWTSQSGYSEQYVSLLNEAWAEEAGNPYFISWEFEGMDTELMTPAQLEEGGRVFAAIYQMSQLTGPTPFPLVINTDPNSTGVTPHFAGGAAWGGHSCPGAMRFNQYPDLIASIQRHLPNSTTGPDMSAANCYTQPDNLYHVFGIGSDGAIYETVYSNGWVGPAKVGNVPGVTLLSVDATTTNSRIDLVAIGSDHHCYHFYRPTSHDPWHGPETLPGTYA